ncbi:MAG: branched-chain amino acid ABC transporter permease [Halolamina sp.]
MTDGGEGGDDTRMDADAGDADRAVTGEAPVDAALGAEGVAGRFRAWSDRLTSEERYVTAAVGAFAGLLVVMVLGGVITDAYMMNLLALAGMYILLSMGLNVQWGYTGLINFSVAAFFGVGAYAAAVLASPDSPVTQGTLLVVTPPGMGPVDLLGTPVAGVFAALLVTAVIAVLFGIPTLSLREDYLAIASLGLAEVIRLIIKNEGAWTGGVQGILGMPEFFVEWPVIGGFVAEVPAPHMNAVVALVFVLATWLVLRRIHRSPWGRAQRLVRSDEDLAEALGKDTYSLRMQSFVIGSVIMGLAGVLFVHINNSLFPGTLKPITTFYVWIAVILGGSGSDRGAIIGGIVVVTIIQGTRFVSGAVPFIDSGSMRLLIVGLVIILIMHGRQQGVLPPQRELIWPGATGGEPNE